MRALLTGPLEHDGNVPVQYLPPQWYAARTRSRHEKSAALQLEQREVESFLPVYECVRKWKDRWARLQLPLFPGYLFVRFAIRKKIDVLTTPGIVDLVGFNGFPAPLREDEVNTLRIATGSSRVLPHKYLSVGRRVRIVAGPLAEHYGILVRHKGHLRVVLTIELLKRSAAIEVEASALAPM